MSDTTRRGLGEPQVHRAVKAVLEQAAPALAKGDLHLGVEFVDSERIRELNVRYRDRHSATDVLSFPVDGQEAAAGPLELGDIVICPERCDDLVEALVHGMLHLLGFDHEADDGEMLELQQTIVDGLGGAGEAKPA